MSDAIARWHAEHANFARLLKLLEGQLDLFHKGESPDYEMMLDIMFYMTHYSDVLHHPKEDLAFARVKEREETARAVVDELIDQHLSLKQSGEALVHALDDIVNGSIASRDYVEVPGRAYISALRQHMEMEEATILPLAKKLLRSRDWAAIDTAIQQFADPLFGGNGEQRYTALRRQIDSEARASKASKQ